MGSVTLYMAAGGTNFAYTAGAAVFAPALPQERWNHLWWMAGAARTFKLHCARSSLHASWPQRVAAAMAAGRC